MHAMSFTAIFFLLLNLLLIGLAALLIVIVWLLRRNPAPPPIPQTGPSSNRTRNIPHALAVAAIVFFVVVGAVMAVTFYLAPVYEGTARITWDSPEQARNSAAIRTALVTIQSDAVLKPVIENLGLNERWAEAHSFARPLPTSSSLQLLRSRLNVRQRPSTWIIEIRVSNRDPDEAAEIANAIVESYRSLATTREITVLDSAEPAWRPARPNLLLNLALGMLVGAFLGLIAGGITLLARR